MASKHLRRVRELKLDLVILNVSMPVMTASKPLGKYVGSHLVRKLAVKRLLQTSGDTLQLFIMLRIRSTLGGQYGKGKDRLREFFLASDGCRRHKPASSETP